MMEINANERLNESFQWLISSAVNYNFVNLDDEYMSAELMQLCYQKGLFEPNEYNENDPEKDLKFMIRMINGYYDPPSQPQIKKAKAVIRGSLLPNARIWYRRQIDGNANYGTDECFSEDDEKTNDSTSAVITYYNGTSYRSRLEAKVAVLLDELNIKYEYEKSVLRMTDDEGEEVRYLPDFTIEQDEKNIVIEAKGMRETCEEEIKKALKFVGTQIDYLVVISEIPLNYAEKAWWFPVFYWNNLDERAVMRRCVFRSCEGEGRIAMHYQIARKNEKIYWNKDDLSPIPSSIYENGEEHQLASTIDGDEERFLENAFYTAKTKYFG